MAATIARAIPVLPDVASISVSPGWISPRFSASVIIDSAGRSLTEPAGLLPSSLARITLLVSRGMRWRRTSGVWPTVSARVGYIVWMPCKGMQARAPGAGPFPALYRPVRAGPPAHFLAGSSFAAEVDFDEDLALSLAASLEAASAAALSSLAFS